MTSLSASACRAGRAGVGNPCAAPRAENLLQPRRCYPSSNHRGENLRRPTASGSQRRLCAEVRSIVTDEARILNVPITRITGSATKHYDRATNGHFRSNKPGVRSVSH